MTQATGELDKLSRLQLRFPVSVAGWSSLVARWAHNPKVGGSNPPPATNSTVTPAIPFFSNQSDGFLSPAALSFHDPIAPACFSLMESKEK